MLKKILPGIVERGAKLTKLGLDFTLKELELSLPRSKEDFLKIKEKQVKELIRILGDLKGASLKIGQALTLDLIETWPSEIRPLIQNLSFKSRPRPTEEVLVVLKSELREKFNLIKNFSQLAHASASIGQVHTGFIDETKVAIKIQYPGIVSSLDHDLKVFRMLVFGMRKIFQKDKMNFDRFFDEMEVTLKNECDYQYELNQLIHFQSLIKKYPNFIIPRPFVEFSTSKILVTEFIEGETFDQWIETSPSPEDIHFVATTLLDLLMKEIFEWGLIQSDAHGGNFLINSKDKKIVLLDFGATKVLSEEFKHFYKDCLKLAFKEDWQGLRNHVLKIGWIHPEEKDEVFEKFRIMINHLISAFKGEFHFKDENYLKQSQKNGWEFVKACEYSSPPRELSFVHRKLGGVFFLLRRLDVKLDLRPFVKDLGFLD
jgi:predicted unusual protein kinase regulating ubiquinone biosynthesis (AarF/ABC1/UbiB family)